MTKCLVSVIGMMRIFIALFLILFSCTGVGADEFQMTPFGLRQKFEAWSTEAGDVTFVLVSRTGVTSKFRLQRAFIFMALNEQKEFAMEINDGVRLNKIDLAVIYPRMTPYAFRMVPEGEVNPRKVPIEDQIMVEMETDGLSSERRWSALVECCIVQQLEPTEIKKGIYKEGTALGFDQYKRYTADSREPFEVLLRPRDINTSLFSYIKCIDEKIGLCTTYLDINQKTHLSVHSFNILKSKDVALHRQQMKQIIDFLESKQLPY